MTETAIVGFILIILNIAFSYKGFTNAIFFDGYKFDVDRILINKDYKRLVTAGFLHVSWMHLIFNMLSLYAFSKLIETNLGEFKLLIIYCTALIGGNLLALFVHKNHGGYTAVGASGAVCGIIFASIALFPDMGIGFFGLPFSIPSWLYGIIYIAFSIYGIKSGKDNIGHEAHLGGALIGMAVALLLVPSALADNYITILIIAVPTIAFIYLLITKPQILFVDALFNKTPLNQYSIDHKYNADTTKNQKEIDKILDKISLKGMDSLSKNEKDKLKKYSEKVH